MSGSSPPRVRLKPDPRGRSAGWMAGWGLGRLPRHVAVEVRRMGAGGEGGVLPAGSADGGVVAVAGEDDGGIGKGIQAFVDGGDRRSEEHTSELQSPDHL